MDVRAANDAQIFADSRKVIPTGFSVEVPDGYELQVRSRSGLALREGVFVLNSPGTIDSDYRGEVVVILQNTTRSVYNVKRGDRIAQLVLAPVARAAVTEVEDLTTTERGENGLGSTGND